MNKVEYNFYLLLGYITLIAILMTLFILLLNYQTENKINTLNQSVAHKYCWNETLINVNGTTINISFIIVGENTRICNKEMTYCSKPYQKEVCEIK